jgi:hypothetical protein
MKTVLNHRENVNEIIMLAMQLNPSVSISGLEIFVPFVLFFE